MHSIYCFFRSSFAGVGCVLTPLSSVDFWKLGKGLKGAGILFQGTRHPNISHLRGWNSISILLVCVFSADVHRGLWWLICAFWNRKLQPLLEENWISLGQALLLECAGALGILWEPQWIFCLWCFGFSRWLWSESHPTDHCDPQTRGGHFWGESWSLLYRTALHSFLVIGESVFVFLCCFEVFARKISSFVAQGSNQKDFVACVR